MFPNNIFSALCSGLSKNLWAIFHNDNKKRQLQAPFVVYGRVKYKTKFMGAKLRRFSHIRSRVFLRKIKALRPFVWHFSSNYRRNIQFIIILVEICYNWREINRSILALPKSFSFSHYRKWHSIKGKEKQKLIAAVGNSRSCGFKVK